MADLKGSVADCAAAGDGHLQQAAHQCHVKECPNPNLMASIGEHESIVAFNNRKLSNSPTELPHGIELPPEIITRRTRRQSVTDRASLTDAKRGVIKYFCRQKGHGFITPSNGGDDIFVHITDIEGEFVPHQGDEVVYKECPLPPRFDKNQAIHVTIKNLNPKERHEKWSEPPMPHAHPHPAPVLSQSP